MVSPNLADKGSNGIFDRKKVQVQFKVKTSKLMDMPGEGLAGTIFGMFVFKYW